MGSTVVAIKGEDALKIATQDLDGDWIVTGRADELTAFHGLPSGFEEVRVHSGRGRAFGIVLDVDPWDLDLDGRR